MKVSFSLFPVILFKRGPANQSVIKQQIVPRKALSMHMRKIPGWKHVALPKQSKPVAA